MSNLFRWAATVFAIVLVARAGDVVHQPARLIVDTDIGNDIDDVLALAMVHSLQSRGEVRLIAVTISKDNAAAATAVKVLNEFYGRPSIPIGLVRDGVSKETSGMLEALIKQRTAEHAPDAGGLLRRTLEGQPDGSVDIVQIGFSTNLARLVADAEGLALVKKKVKLLTLMAGNFAERRPEFNIENDPVSARALTARWPTDIIFSGYEIGRSICHPLSSVRHDFQAWPNHPVVEAWMQFGKGDQDRPSYDETAVLQAVRPNRGYFGLSERGTVSVEPDGSTTFVADPLGKCRYLTLKHDRIDQIEQVEADLVSQPPALRQPPSPFAPHRRRRCAGFRHGD